MSIWYPGSGVTYPQYLQAGSFVKDITSQISKQTEQYVASNQELAEVFESGFDAVSNTLEWGFNRVEDIMHGVATSIDLLRSDFNYNMGLLIEKVQIQNKLLSDLLDKLDAIHKTLESPMLTQAREYYRIGCERLAKGLLDKALEAFSEANKKNDADFFTQFHIGKLYLYGVDEDDNVLDLEKAKRHLLFAARFAKAEINIDEIFSKFAAEALLHASIAIYAQLGEKEFLDDSNKTNTYLQEAKNLVIEAITLHPDLTEAFYHLAKYSALLNEPKISVSNLEKAIVLDRNYAVKVDVDHSFDNIRQQVLTLLVKLNNDKKLEAQTRINQAKQAINDLSLWHPEESDSLNLQFSECKQNLEKSKEHLDSGTFFGFLDAISLVDSIILSTSKIEHEKINTIKEQINRTVRETENFLSEARMLEHFLIKGEVEKEFQTIEKLTLKAKSHLDKISYESFTSALSNVKEAASRMYSAKEIIQDRSEAKRLSKLRDEASSRFAKKGAVIGAIVGMIGGCYQCVDISMGNRYGPSSSGLAWFVLILIAGIVVGAALGMLIGQMKKPG